MKTFFASAFLLMSAAACPQSGAPTQAGEDSTTRMISQSVTSASSVLKGGKKLTLTVDNRSVPYTGKLIGKTLYVPIRFFSEAGLKVTWDGRDTLATIQDENGPLKRSVEFATDRAARNAHPTPAMRPVFQKGQLWVPLGGTLASFGLVAEWVPTSSRLNIRSIRPGG